MIKQLFSDLLTKLKTEEKNDSDTRSGCFKYFEEVILEEKFNKRGIVTYRTLVDYYKKYVDGIENNSGEPKTELKDLIAKYLGFKSYLDFERQNSSEINTSSNLGITKVDSKKIKPTKKYIIVGVLVFVSVVIIFTLKNSLFSKGDCIIWVENHFEEANCKNKKAIDNKIYTIDIENFKQIEVNNKTTFFENGKELVWYGKSKDDKIDFFNHRGIHPETLDELKPVTEYIINKYVFVDDADKTILE